MRLALAGLLLLACACSPGPTLVLGRLPDADVDDQSDEDAGVGEPCNDGVDCTSDERPFCSERLERCVVCTRDRHCGEAEACSARGRCVSQR